jgi:hypothetical protein
MHPACQASLESAQIDGMFFHSIWARSGLVGTLRGLRASSIWMKADEKKPIQSITPVNSSGT